MRILYVFLIAFYPLATLRAQTSPSMPRLYYLAADACGAEATNQYFLYKTGTTSYNFLTAPPRVQSACPTGLINGVVTSYVANANAVAVLNALVGPCKQPVFRNLMAAPYNGVAPAGARVMAFVSANPNLAGMGGGGGFAALCGAGPIYVAFGNYNGSTPFFNNNQNNNSNCGTYNEVAMSVGGVVQQTIQYTPLLLSPQDGAYVMIEPTNVVWYGLAPGCVSPGLNCPHPPPNIAIAGDLSLCEGEKTTLTANAGPGYTYNWSNGTAGASTEVAPGITSDYYVTATNSLSTAGCSTVAKVTVEVFTLPTVKMAAIGENPNQSVCYGQSVQLVWGFQQNIQTPYNYHWIPPNPGVLLIKDRIDPLDENSAGPYRLFIQFNNGCTLDKTIEVAYPAPVPIRVCNNAPVCAGESITLEASANGDAFSWSGPGGYAATGPAQVLNNPAPGAYTVTVSDANGCTSTATTSVVVNNCTPVTTGVGNRVWLDANNDGIQNNNEAGLANIPVSLLYDADQDGDIDDTLSSTFTDNNGMYSFTDLSPNTPYVLQFYVDYGFFFTFYQEGPDPTADSDALQDGGMTLPFTLDENLYNPDIDAGVQCALSDVFVTARGSDVTCFNGTNGSILVAVEAGIPPFNFDWADLSGTSDPASRTNLPAGTYTVSITDSVGCIVVKTTTIEQPPSELVVAGQITLPVCNSNSGGAIDVTTSGGSTPYIFDWQDLPPNSDPEDRSNLSMGTYTLTVRAESGCTATYVADLTGCNNNIVVYNGGIKTTKAEENDPGTDTQKKVKGRSAVANEPMEGLAQVYPNPAAHYFLITMPAEWGICRISVHDALSRELYKVKAGEHAKVQVAGWAAGTYFIKIQPELAEPAQPVWLTLEVRGQ